MDQSEIAYMICEAMYNQYSWMIIVSDVIMILPYIYLLVKNLSGQTVFSKIMALNNPVIIFVGLKLITNLMPTSAFKLTFTNGLMSEAMFVWFIVYILFLIKHKKESY